MMGNEGEVRVHDITSPYRRHIYNLKNKNSLWNARPPFVHVTSCFPLGGLAFWQLIGQPVQTLVQTRPLRGAGRLNVPLTRQQQTRQLLDTHHINTRLLLWKEGNIKDIWRFSVT